MRGDEHGEWHARDAVHADRVVLCGIYNTGSIAVAEHAIGCIFALARNFIQLDHATRAGNFLIRDKLFGTDLAGKVLGVVGLGIMIVGYLFNALI